MSIREQAQGEGHPHGADGNKSASDAFPGVDKKLKNALSTILKKEQFTAKVGETIVYHTNGSSPCGRVILAGVGKLELAGEDIFRRAASSAAQAARRAACSSVAFALPASAKGEETRMAQVVAEGALLGAYRFIKFKTKEEEIEANKQITAIIVHAKKNARKSEIPRSSP